jgi:hypothetical protein
MYPMDSRSSLKDCFTRLVSKLIGKSPGRIPTITIMIVNTCIAVGAAKRATFEILVALGIAELLGQTKVHSVEYVPVRLGSY